ncbi:cytochrome c biogenesis protein CcdA [Halorubrum sp. DTA98]|uniref:cytochrome c biogenesis protein CcdA n=1 Tax=Halorubrum sp. DTA98 TaxID=3402163 RepID=UPI003AACC082
MTGVTAATAFAAGVGAAAFFSPCSYALLPGYVGYYVSASNPERSPVAGAALRGSAAALGAVATFTVLGGLTAVVGNSLRSVIPTFEAGVGIVLVALGTLVVAEYDVSAHVPLPRRRTGVVGFGLFGAMYALAAAGCVSPLFLAVVVQALALPPAGVLSVFAALAGTFVLLLLGATVVIAAGHSAGTALVSGMSRRLTRLGGVLLVVGGVVQLWLAL